MYQYWRKAGRGAMYFLAVLGTMTALYLIVALLLGTLSVNNSYAQATEGIEVFVTDNGVHTDWVLPVNTPYIDWRSKLHLQDYAGADSSFTHVSFGWGDRQFYMETPEWSDLTLTTAITSLFWPTRTAMHVEYIPAPLKPNKKQRPLVLTPQQYEALVNYILKTFQQQNGQFLLIPDHGYYDTDNFYEAHGKFHLFKTCNSWTNGGLKAIGAEAALWAPFSFLVMRHLPEE
ncbi:TIGR02117 family protein [Pontibacter ruber]|uniref:TIGR02117 family protein n=1 Tax=Pontibacter ruber TaxID=1343895 RepID=A0ABW5CXK8_9BACT|nr:TIGR02117 family protein [Pontibacter ruber]